jgi:hypothetical protein
MCKTFCLINFLLTVGVIASNPIKNKTEEAFFSNNFTINSIKSSILSEIMLLANYNNSQNASTTHVELIFDEHTNPNKIPSKLKKELSESFADALDIYSICLVDQMREICQKSLRKFDQQKQGSLIERIGFRDCFRFSNKKEDKSNQANGAMCPWHSEIRFREDMYPVFRAHAICNCNISQKITEKLGNSLYQSYRCKQVFTLQPALFKENLGKQQRWVFGYEEIPTSCITFHPKIIL